MGALIISVAAFVVAIVALVVVVRHGRARRAEPGVVAAKVTIDTGAAFEAGTGCDPVARIDARIDARFAGFSDELEQMLSQGGGGPPLRRPPSSGRETNES